MKNCTGIRCIMQNEKVDPETCKAISYCEYATPPATNGDRIRAMSDEELANLFSEMVDCERGCDARKEKCWMTDSTCCLAWLDWLKEEAKK